MFLQAKEHHRLPTNLSSQQGGTGSFSLRVPEGVNFIGALRLVCSFQNCGQYISVIEAIQLGVLDKAALTN